MRVKGEALIGQSESGLRLCGVGVRCAHGRHPGQLGRSANQGERMADRRCSQRGSRSAQPHQQLHPVHDVPVHQGLGLAGVPARQDHAGSGSQGARNEAAVSYNRPPMKRAWIAALLVASGLLLTTACGPSVDLSKALQVTDVLTGYYDAGLKDGWNYLKPSISFRLHNVGGQKIGPVQITVAFWRSGEDGEWDSTVLQGVHAEGLAAGASTDSLLARCNVGYTLEGARSTFFSHHLFQDVTAKLFASQGGRISPLGQFKLDRE